MKRPKIFCFCKTEVKRLLVAGILLLTTILLADLNAANVFAASLTISQSGAIEVDAIPGVFSTNHNTITVDTDNYTGYTMTTAIGNSTSLFNTTQGSQAYIPTITLPSGHSYIIASEFSGTSWGLSLNNSTFVPLANDILIRSTNAATSGQNADTFNLYVGTLVEPSTEAGTYEQTFTITAVANPAAFTLTYDENTTDTVTNMPGANEAQIAGNLLTLSDKTPVRDGYDFLGWSLNSSSSNNLYSPSDTITLSDTTNNVINLYAAWIEACVGICYDANGGQGGTDRNANATAGSQILLWTSKFRRDGYGFAGWNTLPNGTGTSYGLNETITMPDTGSLRLYAHWIAPEQGVTLQTFDKNSASYANAATGTVIALTDERDGQVYTVSKLEDGEWWIVENLRLNLGEANTTIDITNTNNPTNAFVTAAATKPASTASWCTDNTAACNDQILFNADNTTHGTTGQNNTRYGYGHYYNWYTATAGNGVYDIASGNVTGDICPAGWHLPTGTGSGEFGKLSNALGGLQINGVAQNMTTSTNPTSTTISNAFRKSTENMVYAGYQQGAAISRRGTNGDASYWTATAVNNNNAYRFNVGGTTSVVPGTASHAKYIGSAVRCIANDVISHTLYYNGNGGSNVPAQTTINSNTRVTFTVTSDVPSNYGYNFLGWATTANATEPEYQAGDTITTTSPVTNLYAVWEAVCTGICYDANGGSGPSNLTQTIASGVTEVELWASDFYRDGYGFAGWNTKADGTGTTYGPNETITMPASGKLWLYANWIQSAGNLQGFSCNSLGAGEVTALTDTRDGQTYAVSKLADGRCWMIENLRLNPADSNTTITAANTNNPTSTFVDDIANNYKGNTSATLWKNCTINDAACDDQVSFGIGNINRDPATAHRNRGAQDVSWYSYGVMYNWYTATAGNGLRSSTTKAAGDICPAGWHLPTGIGYGEYGNLSNSLGGYNNNGFAEYMSTATTPTGAEMLRILHSYPNNFISSGYYEGTTAEGRGSGGFYYTSSPTSTSNSTFILYLAGGLVYPGTNTGGYRYEGRAVRCMANYATVTFDANGGTVDGDSTKQIEVAANQALGDIVPEYASIKQFNKVFLGWNTAIDGSGTTVDENTIAADGDTYYAQWRNTTFPTVWHQDGTCEFNGKNGVISGTECSDYAGDKYIDTGIALYDATNHDLDYEIGFKIEQYSAGAQNSGGQETIMNTKLEGTGYPGLVFRRNGDRLELASRRTSGANSFAYFEPTDYNYNDLTVRIVRRKNDQNKWAIFYSIDGGELIQINDLSSYNPTFDLNVWFGAAPKNADASVAQRWLTGKLSNMYIKLGTYEEY